MNVTNGQETSPSQVCGFCIFVHVISELKQIHNSSRCIDSFVRDYKAWIFYLIALTIRDTQRKQEHKGSTFLVSYNLSVFEILFSTLTIL